MSLILGTQSNDIGDAASSPRVAAVAAVFPPTDLGPYVALDNPLREQFPALKFEPQKADQYSPLKHVSKDDAPTFLIHGDKDEVFPIEYIVNHILVKGGTHIMILNKYKWMNENLPKIMLSLE